MNELSESLLQVTEFLDARSIPYMVIGGFANLHWGRPRITEDIDITMSLNEPELAAFIEQLRTTFHVLPQDALTFARETRVIPLTTTASSRIDLILAGLPYEEQAIRRAVILPIEGKGVRVCAPEDLVLYKIISERPRDLEDVEGIVIRQGERLDRGYLDTRVNELATLLSRPEITAFYHRCLDKAKLT